MRKAHGYIQLLVALRNCYPLAVGDLVRVTIATVLGCTVAGTIAGIFY